ncbi:hypothetical protein K2Q16_03100 [Patescibacteria group bacterium]|nr:hypothetical protein [Patescibacteria group bacterium]
MPPNRINQPPTPAGAVQPRPPQGGGGPRERNRPPQSLEEQEVELIKWFREQQALVQQKIDTVLVQMPDKRMSVDYLNEEIGEQLKSAKGELDEIGTRILAVETSNLNPTDAVAQLQSLLDEYRNKKNLCVQLLDSLEKIKPEYIKSPQSWIDAKTLKVSDFKALLENFERNFAAKGVEAAQDLVLLKQKIEASEQLIDHTFQIANDAYSVTTALEATKAQVETTQSEIESLFGSLQKKFNDAVVGKEVLAEAKPQTESKQYSESAHEWVRSEAASVQSAEAELATFRNDHPALETSSRAEFTEINNLLNLSKRALEAAAKSPPTETNKQALALYKSKLEANRARITDLITVLAERIIANPPAPADYGAIQEKAEKENAFLDVRMERRQMLEAFKMAEAAMVSHRDEHAKKQAALGEFKNYFAKEAVKSPEYLAAEAQYFKAGAALKETFYKKRETAKALGFSAPTDPTKALPDKHSENKEDQVMYNTIVLSRVQGELKAREDALNAARSESAFGKGMLLYDKMKQKIAGSAVAKGVGEVLYGSKNERRKDGKMLLRGKLLVGGVGALAVAGGGLLGLGAAAGAWATTAAVGMGAKYGTKSVLTKLLLSSQQAALEKSNVNHAGSMRTGSIQVLQRIANSRILAQANLKKTERIVRDVTTGVGIAAGAAFGMGGGRAWAEGVFSSGGEGAGNGLRINRTPQPGVPTYEDSGIRFGGPPEPPAQVPRPAAAVDQLGNPTGARPAEVGQVPAPETTGRGAGSRTAVSEAVRVGGPREFPTQIVEVTSAHSRRGLTGILDNAIRSGNPEIYQGLTPVQRDRMLQLVMNEVQANPELRARVGVTTGHVDRIIAGKDRINVHDLLQLAQEKSSTLRGTRVFVPPVSIVPEPLPVPVVEVAQRPPFELSSERLREFAQRATAQSDGPEVLFRSVPVNPDTDVIDAEVSQVAAETPEVLEDVRSLAVADPEQVRGTYDDDEGSEVQSLVVEQPAERGGRRLRIEVSEGEGVVPVRDRVTRDELLGDVVQPAAPLSSDDVFTSTEEATLENPDFQKYVTERYGDEQKFLKIREAMTEKVNARTQTFFGFLTGANENTAERVFGNRTIADFEGKVSRPTIEQSGVKLENFNRWRREVVALATKLEDIGVKVDPNETTVEQIITLAAANDVDSIEKQLVA